MPYAHLLVGCSNAMEEDAKELANQFYWDLITNPQGPEQFVMSIVLLVIAGAVILVTLRLVQGLLR